MPTAAHTCSHLLTPAGFNLPHGARGSEVVPYPGVRTRGLCRRQGRGLEASLQEDSKTLQPKGFECAYVCECLGGCGEQTWVSE